MCQDSQCCSRGVTTRTPSCVGSIDGSACTSLACDDGGRDLSYLMTLCMCLPGHVRSSRTGECTLCPGGITNSNRTSCEDCTPGHFCSLGADMPTPCGGSDRYCPSGSTSYTLVPEGSYSTPLGFSPNVRTGAAVCAPGFTCSGGERVACRAEGKYCPYSNMSEPVDVAPGYAIVAEGDGLHREVEICPVGHYCLNGKAVKCPPGTYGDRTGLDSAACAGSCPDGSYCSAGATKPDTPCPAGAWCRNGQLSGSCYLRGHCQGSSTTSTVAWLVGGAAGSEASRTHIVEQAGALGVELTAIDADAIEGRLSDRSKLMWTESVHQRPAIVVPSLASSLTVALGSSEESELAAWVRSGGSIVVFGDESGHGIDSLNEMFGWSIGDVAVSTTPEAGVVHDVDSLATQIKLTEPLRLTQGSVAAVDVATLPLHAQSLWGADVSSSWVWSVAVECGAVTYIGHTGDWDPTSGWTAALDSAVRFSHGRSSPCMGKPHTTYHQLQSTQRVGLKVSSACEVFHGVVAPRVPEFASAVIANVRFAAGRRATPVRAWMGRREIFGETSDDDVCAAATQALVSSGDAAVNDISIGYPSVSRNSEPQYAGSHVVPINEGGSFSVYVASPPDDDSETAVHVTSVVIDVYGYIVGGHWDLSPRTIDDVSLLSTRGDAAGTAAVSVPLWNHSRFTSSDAALLASSVFSVNFTAGEGVSLPSFPLASVRDAASGRAVCVSALNPTPQWAQSAVRTAAGPELIPLTSNKLDLSAESFDFLGNPWLSAQVRPIAVLDGLHWIDASASALERQVRLYTGAASTSRHVGSPPCVPSGSSLALVRVGLSLGEDAVRSSIQLALGTQPSGRTCYNADGCGPTLELSFPAHVLGPHNVNAPHWLEGTHLLPLLPDSSFYVHTRLSQPSQFAQLNSSRYGVHVEFLATVGAVHSCEKVWAMHFPHVQLSGLHSFTIGRNGRAMPIPCDMTAVGALLSSKEPRVSSCADIYLRHKSARSGFYTLDKHGLQAVGFCNMTSSDPGREVHAAGSAAALQQHLPTEDGWLGDPTEDAYVAERNFREMGKDEDADEQTHNLVQHVDHPICFRPANASVSFIRSVLSTEIVPGQNGVTLNSNCSSRADVVASLINVRTLSAVPDESSWVILGSNLSTVEAAVAEATSRQLPHELGQYVVLDHSSFDSAVAYHSSVVVPLSATGTFSMATGGDAELGVNITEVGCFSGVRNATSLPQTSLWSCAPSMVYSTCGARGALSLSVPSDSHWARANVMLPDGWLVKGTFNSSHVLVASFTPESMTDATYDIFNPYDSSEVLYGLHTLLAQLVPGKLVVVAGFANGDDMELSETNRAALASIGCEAAANSATSQGFVCVLVAGEEPLEDVSVDSCVKGTFDGSIQARSRGTYIGCADSSIAMLDVVGSMSGISGVWEARSMSAGVSKYVAWSERADGLELVMFNTLQSEHLNSSASTCGAVCSDDSSTNCGCADCQTQEWAVYQLPSQQCLHTDIVESQRLPVPLAHRSVFQHSGSGAGGLVGFGRVHEPPSHLSRLSFVAEENSKQLLAVDTLHTANSGTDPLATSNAASFIVSEGRSAPNTISGLAAGHISGASQHSNMFAAFAPVIDVAAVRMLARPYVVPVLMGSSCLSESRLRAPAVVSLGVSALLASVVVQSTPSGAGIVQLGRSIAGCDALPTLNTTDAVFSYASSSVPVARSVVIPVRADGSFSVVSETSSQEQQLTIQIYGWMEEPATSECESAAAVKSASPSSALSTRQPLGIWLPLAKGIEFRNTTSFALAAASEDARQQGVSRLRLSWHGDNADAVFLSASVAATDTNAAPVSFEGQEWDIVRYAPDGVHGGPDLLAGAAHYGNSSNDAMGFSVPFSELAYSRLLFADINFSSWAIVDKAALEAVRASYQQENRFSIELWSCGIMSSEPSISVDSVPQGNASAIRLNGGDWVSLAEPEFCGVVVAVFASQEDEYAAAFTARQFSTCDGPAAWTELVRFVSGMPVGSTIAVLCQGDCTQHRSPYVEATLNWLGIHSDTVAYGGVAALVRIGFASNDVLLDLSARSTCAYGIAHTLSAADEDCPAESHDVRGALTAWACSDADPSQQWLLGDTEGWSGMFAVKAAGGFVSGTANVSETWAVVSAAGDISLGDHVAGMCSPAGEALLMASLRVGDTYVVRCAGNCRQGTTGVCLRSLGSRAVDDAPDDHVVLVGIRIGSDATIVTIDGHFAECGGRVERGGGLAALEAAATHLGSHPHQLSVQIGSSCGATCPYIRLSVADAVLYQDACWPDDGHPTLPPSSVFVMAEDAAVMPLEFIGSGPEPEVEHPARLEFDLDTNWTIWSEDKSQLHGPAVASLFGFVEHACAQPPSSIPHGIWKCWCPITDGGNCTIHCHPGYGVVVNGQWAPEATVQCIDHAWLPYADSLACIAAGDAAVPEHAWSFDHRLNTTDFDVVGESHLRLQLPEARILALEGRCPVGDCLSVRAQEFVASAKQLVHIDPGNSSFSLLVSKASAQQATNVTVAELWNADQMFPWLSVIVDAAADTVFARVETETEAAVLHGPLSGSSAMFHSVAVKIGFGGAQLLVGEHVVHVAQLQSLTEAGPVPTQLVVGAYPRSFVVCVCGAAVRRTGGARFGECPAAAIATQTGTQPWHAWSPADDESSLVLVSVGDGGVVTELFSAVIADVTDSSELVSAIDGIADGDVAAVACASQCNMLPASLLSLLSSFGSRSALRTRGDASFVFVWRVGVEVLADESNIHECSRSALVVQQDEADEASGVSVMVDEVRLHSSANDTFRLEDMPRLSGPEPEFPNRLLPLCEGLCQPRGRCNDPGPLVKDCLGWNLGDVCTVACPKSPEAADVIACTADGSWLPMKTGEAGDPLLPLLGTEPPQRCPSFAAWDVASPAPADATPAEFVQSGRGHVQELLDVCAPRCFIEGEYVWSCDSHVTNACLICDPYVSPFHWTYVCEDAELPRQCVPSIAMSELVGHSHAVPTAAVDLRADDPVPTVDNLALTCVRDDSASERACGHL